MPVAASLRRLKLTGVCAAARGAVVEEIARQNPAPVHIVVLKDFKEAEQIAEDIAFFHDHAAGAKNLEVLVFPESMPENTDMREAFAVSADRLTVLSRLRATRVIRGSGNERESGTAAPSARSTLHSVLVVTTPAALLQPVPALEAFATRELTLKKGQAQSFQGLLEKLRELDYDSEAVCEAPGHYAIRGGIIDIYPITANQPYRLDFFGDEIEEIRAFDPVTQRSGEPVEEISLSTSPRVRLDPSKTGIADYLTPRSHLIFIEPAELDQTFSELARESGNDGLAPLLQRSALAIGVSDLDEASALFEDAPDEATWNTESLAHHRSYSDEGLVAQERLQVEEEARRGFLLQTLTWQKNGESIVFVVSKEGEEQRIREILEEDRQLTALKPLFLRGSLNEGFRILAPTRGTSDAAPIASTPTGEFRARLHWRSAK
ncbi:MAG TPA: transcription-repair coupling factor, partial [Opitutaceae bacterium]